MRYLVIYEKSETGWGAYVPDLPGLGVVGASLEEAKTLTREGIEFHLQGITLHGDPIPQPTAQTEYGQSIRHRDHRGMKCFSQ